MGQRAANDSALWPYPASWSIPPPPDRMDLGGLAYVAKIGGFANMIYHSRYKCYHWCYILGVTGYFYGCRDGFSRIGYNRGD